MRVRRELRVFGSLRNRVLGINRFVTVVANDKFVIAEIVERKFRQIWQEPVPRKPSLQLS